jgi:hypothetical protein
MEFNTTSQIKALTIALMLRKMYHFKVMDHAFSLPGEYPDSDMPWI